MAKYQIEEWDGSKDVVEASFYDDLRQEPWVKAVDIIYSDGIIHPVTEDYFYKRLNAKEIEPELSYIDIYFWENITESQSSKDFELGEKHRVALKNVTRFLGETATFFKGRLRYIPF